MMTTLQTLAARALVRIAIWAAPAGKADQLRQVTRPIWAVDSSGGKGEER